MTTGGGQTNFPRAATEAYPDGGPLVRDYFDCSKGLSVYPQAGKAPQAHTAPIALAARLTVARAQPSLCVVCAGKVIIFYSMLPDGSMDDFSLHGGCDVLDEQATKWSANFWLWNKPYHFVDPARKAATQALMASWL